MEYQEFNKSAIDYFSSKEKIIEKWEKELKSSADKIESLKNILFSQSSKVSNLWLLNDQFIGFRENEYKSPVHPSKIKVYTNKEIKDLNQQQSDPDSKIVLVEFKEFNLPRHALGTSLFQLTNYADILEKSGYKEIYLYLIARITSDDRIYLTKNHYNQLFSPSGHIYTQVLKSSAFSVIHVISPEAILSTARHRITENRRALERN